MIERAPGAEVVESLPTTETGRDLSGRDLSGAETDGRLIELWLHGESEATKEAYLADGCERVFEEKVSSREAERTKLLEAFDYCRTSWGGQTLLDRVNQWVYRGPYFVGTVVFISRYSGRAAHSTVCT